MLSSSKKRKCHFNRENEEFKFTFTLLILYTSMSNVEAACVTKQPHDYKIHNSFGSKVNDNFLPSWIFQEGTCGCTVLYYTTLTDTRLLLRSEDPTYCSCYYEPNYNDASISSRDIAKMRESTNGQNCCSLLCAELCGCSTSCYSVPKYMELRRSFGSETLHVTKVDMAKA
jgi:hypothetical protein